MRAVCVLVLWSRLSLGESAPDPSCGDAAERLAVSDEQTFLRLIEQNPGEWGHKLVFADWLDERGDARGEVIRIDARLATQPVDDATRARLTERRAALLRDWLAARVPEAARFYVEMELNTAGIPSRILFREPRHALLFLLSGATEPEAVAAANAAIAGIDVRSLLDPRVQLLLDGRLVAINVSSLFHLPDMAYFESRFFEGRPRRSALAQLLLDGFRGALPENRVYPAEFAEGIGFAEVDVVRDALIECLVHISFEGPQAAQARQALVGVYRHHRRAIERIVHNLAYYDASEQESLLRRLRRAAR